MNTTPIAIAFAAASTLTLAQALASPDATTAAEPGPIATILITGKNNHNWQYTSQVHKDTLEATGRFIVDICDNPEVWLADAEAIAGYKLFVIDYNDVDSPKRWPEQAEKNFENAVKNGMGVVAIHSANNAFWPKNGAQPWVAYEQMLALHWRENTGHGKFHNFDVAFTDAEHPITKGLPSMKNHPDELYHNLANPQAAKYKLLAQAFDKKDIGGTEKNEPMAITNTFGKGRIFATALGHVWVNAMETKVSVTNPQFKTFLCRGAEWAANGEVTLPATWKDVRVHNTIGEKESGQGWKLLFDGKTAKLRGFKQTGWPKEGWKIENGELVHEAGKGGGDIITMDQYANFEFEVEWMATKGANSGIIYRCTEDKNATYETGREMQILDDANHNDGKKEKTRAGTMYDVYKCVYDVARPAGEWNRARVVCNGSKIEHWLNGFKVVETDTQTPAYAEAVANSKFPSMPDYGKRDKGFIALQDHGDEVRFRNIKVRVLP